MVVRYNTAVAAALIAVGSVGGFLAVWVSMLGEVNPGVYVMWVPIMIGILYLCRPYFSVEATSVVVYSLIGPVKREFPYQSLEFADGKLVAVRADGTRTKVPAVRWLARPGDWAAAAGQSR